MPADILVCCCRFCSRRFNYSAAEAGAQSRCPHCGQMVMLPGHLQLIAVKKRERKNTLATLSMEIGGFILMVFWPWGTVLGIGLVILGWRQAYQLRCGNCEAVVENADASKCRYCKAQFTSE